MRISSALISLLLAAAFCCLPGAVNAFALTAEDLCAAMPPENGAAADALFNQVLAEGDALIFALCDRIARRKTHPTPARGLPCTAWPNMLSVPDGKRIAYALHESSRWR